MKKILIADSNKASLVMTSEIFKEHYPGIQIRTTMNAIDTLAIIKQEKNFDICVIDFDLIDENGAVTALQVKKKVKVPVLLTAYDNKEVLDILGSKFKNFKEGQNFLRKPLNGDMVKAVCSYFYNSKDDNKVSCSLNAGLLYQNLNSLLTHNNDSYFPVHFKEFSFDCARFSFVSNYLNSSQQKILKKNILKPAVKLFFFFTDPYDIEIGKTVIFENGLKLDHNIFPYRLSAKVLPFTHQTQDNSFWIEFDDILMSKRIFESIIRSKTHETFSLDKFYF